MHTQDPSVDDAKRKAHLAFLEVNATHIIVLYSHPLPQTIADQLHGSQELEQIWTVLQQVSASDDDGEQWLTYPAFLQVRAFIEF